MAHYISSDELEGRAVFAAGFGLAAAYVEDHLRSWGVKPAGDRGSGGNKRRFTIDRVEFDGYGLDAP